MTSRILLLLFIFSSLEAISCPVGYHVDGGNCQPNQCYCNRGNPKRLCSEHRSESCSSCVQGYLLENNACVKKIDNTANNQNQRPPTVTSCPAGYHPSEDLRTCQKNYCKCTNGYKSDFCPKNQAESCSACQKDYQLNVDATTGYNICQLTCPKGFYQSNGKTCQANICTCNKGQGKKRCHKHNSNSCKRCHFGYSLQINVGETALFGEEIFTCEKNVCTCANGTPESLCDKKSKDRCNRCDFGFLMRNRRCVSVGQFVV